MPNFKYVGLAALVGRATEAIAAGVQDAANDLVREANQAAPIESGALRASIQNEGVKTSGTVAEAKVTTGGEVSDYAIVQHERTDFAHIEGQAKYIEEPLLAMAGRYRSYIAKKVRAAL